MRPKNVLRSLTARSKEARVADLRYAGLFVLSCASLGLLALLRSFEPPIIPALSVAATLTLFVLPGMLVALALPDRHFSGLARLPVALVFSTGLFGVLAVPMLVLHRNLDLYLLLSCGVVGVSLAVAAYIALHIPRRSESGRERTLQETLLWVPFVFLGAVLAYVSRLAVKPPGYDYWYYQAYVGEYLSTDSLASSSPFQGAAEAESRMNINGWLVEQAALSRVSGVDPADLVTGYLAPVLIFVLFLGLYALGRVVFEGEAAALITGSLGALYLTTDLDSLYQTFGGEAIARITEDKFVAWLIFVPMVLSIAILFMRERKPWHLALYAFTCWGIITIHPLGLVFLGIPLTGFGLVHLTLGWRCRETWTSLLGLAAPMLIVGLPPAVYLLATDSPLLSRLESQSTDRASALIRTAEESQSLLGLGDGTFIVHPSLLLEPPVLAAYVLGVPFLLWRSKEHVGARLLLGTLLLVPLLVFLPAVTSLLGPIIGPWTLTRLAWPLVVPVCLLTVGWIVWETLSFLTTRLGRLSAAGRAAPFLPAFCLCVALLATVAPMINGIRAADTTGEALQERTSCQDPAFEWMQSVITEDSLILAPSRENSCVTAYAAHANAMQIRPLDYLAGTPRTELDSVKGQGVPPNILAAQKFMTSFAVDGDMLRTLQEYDVEYVLLGSSPLNEQLEHLPGFEALATPGERYRLYRVNTERLQTTPVVEANGFLNDGEWERAAEAYDAAPTDNADEQYLAYLGLGRAYTELGRYEEAVGALEEATRLFPKELGSFVLLAQAHEAAGDLSAARVAQKKAVLRAPLNVEVRLGLVGLLQKMEKDRKLVEQHREIVEAFPGVPEYHARLGGALVLTEDYGAADEEFRRAERLNPRSAPLFALLGNANKPSGRLEKSLYYYERALDFAPGNPQYSLQVGLMHARISIREDDDGYAEQAERELEEAARAPLSQEQKGAAWFALGQLYERQDSPEKAERAFEESLRINPDFAPARDALEKLDR